MGPVRNRFTVAVAICATTDYFAHNIQLWSLFDCKMAEKGKYFDSPAMRESLKRYIRIQMTSRNLKYRDLSARLEEIGVAQGERTLRNKVSKGNLGAQLFMYILIALDVREIDMRDITDLLAKIKEE